MPAVFTGAAARRGERRFADGEKTMVSGEVGFVIKMSFPASLICGNDYVVYAPQWLRSPKNIFHFKKIKFALPPRKHRQRHAKTPQTET
ncbi:hypothetical protein [Janthinobacterium sp. GW458P]|uniref:hypothetical protein n=1 Tax=Janthinobacterium sp. GW458P TaxID=1981504 RepID=UPI001121F680|nr:hypothetical protein [Janthinobacterium sp. GW458P]MBE3025895.1 hypothetical protein [Janthinobacterium sp. GW458P]